MQDGLLIGVGPSFVFSYDLCTLKERMVEKIIFELIWTHLKFLWTKCSKNFKKNDILSCVTNPTESSQNYELVASVSALGKFDKKILLFSEENDKILFEMKVIPYNSPVKPFKRVMLGGSLTWNFCLPTIFTFYQEPAKTILFIYGWSIYIWIIKFLNKINRTWERQMSFWLISSGNATPISACISIQASMAKTSSSETK